MRLVFFTARFELWLSVDFIRRKNPDRTQSSGGFTRAEHGRIKLTVRNERKVFKVRPWSVDATNDGGQAMGHWPLHPLDGRCLDAADSVAEPTSGCKRPPGQSSNVYGTR